MVDVPYQAGRKRKMPSLLKGEGESSARKSSSLSGGGKEKAIDLSWEEERFYFPRWPEKKEAS